MSIELDDFETRLREMYAAVAATTVVDDPVLDADDGLHPLAADPSLRPRRSPLVAIAAVALLAAVIAAVAVLVARRDDAVPAGPMDGRPFAIPMWMPEDMGLDRAAVIDSSGPLTGMQQSEPVLSARLKYDGANGRIVFIHSADALGLTPLPTGETVVLDDGTVAQWSTDPFPQLTWTLATGQAVAVMGGGTEVSKDELTRIASSLWYVDRATWDRVTAKDGYVHGDFQRWRVPSDGTNVDLVVTGSLRQTLPPYGLRLQTASTGMDYQARTESCTAWATFDGADDKDVVYVAPSTATAVRATGPNGEVVEAPVAMAPGLPLFRWAAISFPDATERWLNATDHSKSCTAVIP